MALSGESKIHVSAKVGNRESSSRPRYRADESAPYAPLPRKLSLEQQKVDETLHDCVVRLTLPGILALLK